MSRRPDFADLSDEQLAARCAREIAYHDRLIDSAPMGDERIYFAGLTIDAMRAEIGRRRLERGA